jgi:hypothetical protein
MPAVTVQMQRGMYADSLFIFLYIVYVLSIGCIYMYMYECVRMWKSVYVSDHEPRLRQLRSSSYLSYVCACFFVSARHAPQFFCAHLAYMVRGGGVVALHICICVHYLNHL